MPAVNEDETGEIPDFMTSAPELTTNEEEKKLTLRLSGHDYNSLKKTAAITGKSMNTLVSDAVRLCYSGFVYSFAHDNEISKGVDKYIFDLLGVAEASPFYENPAKSDKEVFSCLGINTYEQLEAAFLKNIHLIVIRAKIVLSKYGIGGVKTLPIGIAVHYLVFALVAQEPSVHEAVKLANLCWLGFEETISDINQVRSYLGLELIP
jgi:predicted DNA binding CopG/RHH family protein